MDAYTFSMPAFIEAETAIEKLADWPSCGSNTNGLACKAARRKYFRVTGDYHFSSAQNYNGLNNDLKRKKTRQSGFLIFFFWSSASKGMLQENLL